MCLWDIHSQKAYGKYNNENGIGITSLEWDPKGCGTPNGKQVTNHPHVYEVIVQGSEFILNNIPHDIISEGVHTIVIIQ